MLIVFRWPLVCALAYRFMVWLDSMQFARPTLSEQETTLLAAGVVHTALMSASIILTVIYIALTEYDPGTGVVYAVLATWAVAIMEAWLQIKTGSATSVTYSFFCSVLFCSVLFCSVLF
eukprot:SAG31_NODE_1052_length_10154_cov_2.814818_8_plen_119_part_00